MVKIFVHSLVFSPRSRSGRNQSPVMEPMWLLAHRILGIFLGIVCHCFSPPLDVPTFETTCLCVLSDARDPSSERWNCGRERCPVVIYDMGPTALLPLRRKACWGFFRPKNPAASAGFKLANLAVKSLYIYIYIYIQRFYGWKFLKMHTVRIIRTPNRYTCTADIKFL